jgi:hypothetical protein
VRTLDKLTSIYFHVLPFKPRTIICGIFRWVSCLFSRCKVFIAFHLFFGSGMFFSDGVLNFATDNGCYANLKAIRKLMMKELTSIECSNFYPNHVYVKIGMSRALLVLLFPFSDKFMIQAYSVVWSR